MRRGSIKKSSNFKIQAEKSVFRNYLENIENCKTALLYPAMKDVLAPISRSSKLPARLSINHATPTAMIVPLSRVSTMAPKVMASLLSLDPLSSINNGYQIFRRPIFMGISTILIDHRISWRECRSKRTVLRSRSIWRKRSLFRRADSC